MSKNNFPLTEDTSTSIATAVKQWAKGKKLKFIFFNKIDSTNTKAKEIITATDKFLLTLTDTQIKGRGRGSNTWSDENNGQLLSTWSYSIPRYPNQIFPIKIGYKVFQNCKKYWPQLKWEFKPPNDIFISDKKVAGLLIEIEQIDKNLFAHIGLGFNFVSSPKNIPKATSLFIELKSTIETHKLHNFFNDLHTGFLTECSQLPTHLKDNEVIGISTAFANKGPYSNITKDGDLISNKGSLIPWSDL